FLFIGAAKARIHLLQALDQRPLLADPLLERALALQLYADAHRQQLEELDVRLAERHVRAAVQKAKRAGNATCRVEDGNAQVARQADRDRRLTRQFRVGGGVLDQDGAHGSDGELSVTVLQGDERLP